VAHCRRLAGGADGDHAVDAGAFEVAGVGGELLVIDLVVVRERVVIAG